MPALRLTACRETAGAAASVTAATLLEASVTAASCRPANCAMACSHLLILPALHAGEDSGPLVDGLLTVEPHALDDHVAALKGPLQAGDPQ